MKETQIKQFRSEFASIVWLKGLIKDHGRALGSLYHYDKDGSHQKAIEKGLAKRDELKAELIEKLKGKTYEEWKAMSAKLSVLKQRLKRSEEQKARADKSGMRLGYLILKECMSRSNIIIALMPWFTISDSDVRLRYLKKYGLRSVTALPRRTFQYARIQTVVLHLEKSYKGDTLFKVF